MAGFQSLELPYIYKMREELSDENVKGVDDNEIWRHWKAVRLC